MVQDPAKLRTVKKTQRDDIASVHPNTEALVAVAGEQLRHLRKLRGFTLEDLAAKSGVSVGSISQIERGRGNPSLNTLVQLSHALDAAFHRLLPSVERRSPVVRKHERRDLSDPTGAIRQLLTPSFAQTIEAVWIEAPPGHSTRETPFAHPGEEVGIILEGHRTVWVDGAAYELGPGDSITYSSTLPHWFENSTNETVRAIWVISPPTW